MSSRQYRDVKYSMGGTDRGKGRAERAVPDGDSGPQPQPAWRRAAARAPLRGQPLSSFCAAASAPASVPNFPGESRSCLSCGGAALSPGPRNCSPPPLRRQDPLKIWRPRTSFLGPLRESRDASLQNPWLPVDAKFQLVGPEKESAPLVQCDTASEFSGTKSKSCSRSRPGATRVPRRPAVCWWRNCQSACPGVQPASPRAPGDRSAPAAASDTAAAAGSGRGTRAEGERERTARERGEGRKRVITRGRRGPVRLRSGRGPARR
ncbi:uncharacterized protein LOC118992485 [Sturnira hondurensis]|uniref:uncharacterized protein LOC118992485 n=1 Tax=Sturnira hondurensis TaxID=192404 RepID=UPI00187A3D88|nr:uncharacterized protein LOC118992485 [Sturnira hondurensis]